MLQSEKMTRRGTKSLVLLAITAAATSSVKAATLYWDGSGTEWTNAASWSTVLDGANPPDAADAGYDPTAAPDSNDDAVFSASTVTASQSFTVNADRAVRSLSFNTVNTINYNLSGSGGNRVLAVGDGGVVLDAGSGAVTLGNSAANKNIRLKLSASQLWTNNSAKLLYVRNNAGLEDSLTSDAVWTLNAAGTGGISVGSGVTDSTAGGKLSVTVASTGTGVVSFGGANYSGDTILQSGKLSVGSISNSAIYLGDVGGTSDATLTLTNSGDQTVTGNITVQAGNSGNVSLAGSNVGSVTFTGTLALNKNLTVNTGAKVFTFNETVSGTGQLTKSGSGTVEFRGNNTHTGDLFLDDGTFALSNIATNGVSTGQLLFKIQDATSNRVYGDSTNATALFDGIFKLDVGSVTVDSGSWNLIDTATLNETFGVNFSVVDSSGQQTFTEAGNVWTSSNGRWTFDESSGTLALAVPEPGSLAMLGAGAALLIGRRRRGA